MTIRLSLLINYMVAGQTKRTNTQPKHACMHADGVEGKRSSSATIMQKAWEEEEAICFHGGKSCSRKASLPGQIISLRT